MENSMVLGVNYDEMLSNLNYEQVVALQEKLKEQRILQLDKRVVGLEEKNRQLEKELERAVLKLEDSEGKIKVIVEDFKGQKEKTSQITDTLMSDNDEKRRLEKEIHRLAYTHVPKGTLRSELFHGNITAGCKAHLRENLNATRFDRIMIIDVDVAIRLVQKFMTKSKIQSIMRKSAKTLFEQSQKSKKDNEKRLGTGNGRKYELLDQLLEEVGGDINAI